MDAAAASLAPARQEGLARRVLGLFKLRIGVVIMATALAGAIVTPGAALSPLQWLVLALSVLVASASAGAFNQYVEHDSDRLMARTRSRAFATGALRHTPAWLGVICALVAAAVAAAWLALNATAALFVFLGAFFYAVVYTVWLKRRTWLNIVVGGLAGSFAVLAGAAAVDPAPQLLPLLFALVLFLWTPPHFWSLAIACRDDYVAAGVPMLPVVVGTPRAARAVLAGTAALVAASLAPAFFGLGAWYLAGALAGGLFFLWRAWQLARAPGRASALASFHASLLQLSLLLVAAGLDVLLS